MIYVRLAGGLGNQLYQLATADYFAERLSCKFLPVLAGLSRYKVPRQPDSLKLVGIDRLARGEVGGFDQFLSDRLRCGLWLPKSSVNERRVANGLSSLELGRHSKIYVDGYFQECWIYEEFEKIIASWQVQFSARSSIEIPSRETCIVHIRGGDFLSVPLHQVVDWSYYLNCIHLAVDQGFKQFLVVTDDVPYAESIVSRVRNEIVGLEINFHEPCSALDDFSCISAGAARIIGNSTFAWWAAALDVQKGTTWAPRKFIRSGHRSWFLPWENIVDFEAHS